MPPSPRSPRTYDPLTRGAMPSDQVTWLHLLRHGQVVGGDRRLCRGHLDDPLSEAGLAESRALADFCVARLPRPDGVLTSDLARTRALARDLGDRLGLPVREHPELREQWMGTWEGREWRELNAEDPAGVAAFWDDYLRARPGGGETFAEMGDRVLAFWRGALPGLTGGRFLVVTHIGVIRVLCCSLLGLDLDQALRFAPGYASHTQLGWAEAGGVMTTLGERAWTGSDRQ